MSEKAYSCAPCVGIMTLGCRVNQYESRAIAEEFEKRGFIVRSFSESCDLYVINTCAVTAESERKSRQMARRALKNNPKAHVLLTGCQAQLHPKEAAELPGVKYVGGNSSKLEVVDAAERLLKDSSSVIKATREISDVFELYSVRTPDHTRAYIKIEDGCQNKCAYCVIPKVRGPVRSKPFEDVLDEVRAVASVGYREIVLTGIEVTDYQYDLCGLVKAISETEGIERIRLASVNPSFIDKNFADTVKGIKQFCPHLHLSLQSCSDNVLRAMRRPYNTKLLKNNIEYIKAAIPNIAFTADLICGFPGETDADFEETLRNVEEIGLIHAHIFPYSPRPETEAAEMKEQIPENIKNSRCERLSKLCENSRDGIIEGFVKKQKVFSVLLEEKRKGRFYGHTENFIEVALRTDNHNQGEIIQVTLSKQIDRTGVWLASEI